MTRIIALTGKKQSGKTTVVKYLMQEYGFMNINFADPLKAICSILYPKINFFLDDYKEDISPHYNMSARQILQQIGTEIFRNCWDPNIWTRRLKESVDSYYAHFNIVIGDTRFDNEVELIKSLNGKIWHLNRESNLYIDHHESERGVTISPDFEIFNDGTIEDLNNSIDILMNMNVHSAGVIYTSQQVLQNDIR
jgi:predicted AAA+ superfamily ATPase